LKKSHTVDRQGRVFFILPAPFHGISVKLSGHFGLDVDRLDRLEYAKFERFKGTLP